MKPTRLSFWAGNGAVRLLRVDRSRCTPAPEVTFICSERKVSSREYWGNPSGFAASRARFPAVAHRQDIFMAR
jgi:hypothetical protein